jgi:hypothetical protein
MKLAAVLAFAALLAPLHAAPEPARTLLDEGYRHMYNLQFQEAHRVFAEWQRLHPEDPLGPVSDAAACLYAEFERLKILQSEYFASNEGFFSIRRQPADPNVKKRFEANLARASQLAAQILKTSPTDPNARFAQVMRCGLLSDYQAMVEKRYWAALGTAKEARLAAESLLRDHPEYYDAYVPIGVENYLLSLRAAPVRWFLRLNGAQTDRQTGLAKLRLAAEHGRFLMPYARLLLAVAALRESDKRRACQTLVWLSQEFPRNHLYREELAKLSAN